MSRRSAPPPDDKPPIGPVLDHYSVRYSFREGWQPIICPVHDDSNASASLNLDEGVINCHGCSFGGDVYQLIMERDHVDFKTARFTAESIARASGVDVRTRDAGERSEYVSSRPSYKPAYRRAAQARVRRPFGQHP